MSARLGTRRQSSLRVGFVAAVGSDQRAGSPHAAIHHVRTSRTLSARSAASHRSASMPRARKVVLLGDFGVGKTSFGTRLAKESSTSRRSRRWARILTSRVRAAGDGPLAPATKLGDLGHGRPGALPLDGHVEIVFTRCCGRHRRRGPNAGGVLRRGGTRHRADPRRRNRLQNPDRPRGEQERLALAPGRGRGRTSRSAGAYCADARGTSRETGDGVLALGGRWSGPAAARGAAVARASPRGTFLVPCVLLAAVRLPACPSPSAAPTGGTAPPDASTDNPQRRSGSSSVTMSATDAGRVAPSRDHEEELLDLFRR